MKFFKIKYSILATGDISVRRYINGINLRRIVGIVRGGLFFRDSGNVIKASHIPLSSIYRSVSSTIQQYMPRVSHIYTCLQEARNVLHSTSRNVALKKKKIKKIILSYFYFRHKLISILNDSGSWLMPKSIPKLRKRTTNDAMMHLCCRKGFVRVTSNCATSMLSGTLIINGDYNFIMQITKWPSGCNIGSSVKIRFFFLRVRKKA